MKKFAIVLMALMLAGSVMAADKTETILPNDVANMDLQGQAGSRDMVEESFCLDIATIAPVPSYATGTNEFGDIWVDVPEGAYSISFGWDDLMFNTIHHDGESWGSWASEVRLGITGSYMGDAGYMYTVQVTDEYNEAEEGGVFLCGPYFHAEDVVAGAGTDFAPEAGRAHFVVYNTWDDGTGLPMAELLSGTICVTITYDESVATDEASFSQIKALY